MKITQEVREFARLNPSPPSGGEGDSAKRSGERGPDPEAGMAEMSRRFHDEGGEIYLPAADRP
jgi:phosphomethylpyrimidine synthase